ncbi:N-acyl homoserine lactonase family protein [Dehalobacter sp. DCM]|uniref:N-acyl homoserine lactonase family protein n=1 Tax=Dehalobacter sp. DCM TaxID=2907827 RepID=UPI003081F739|nr:N-acyl homoserine lactonase family protein [Dehalobacter sp. DCM]
MKLYVLNNGWIDGNENEIYDNLNETGSDNVSAKWNRIPIYAVLIDHPAGKIIYDLGCHPDAMHGYWCKNLTSKTRYGYDESNLLTHQLALTGTKVEDIKTVVLSHLHPDHTGNLYLFEHADIYVPREDFIHALMSVHACKDPAAHGLYVKASLEVPVKQYHLIDHDIELLPGIELVTLPGHTPGLLGLIVHLPKEGTLVFPQDAINDRRVYGPPAQEPGLAYDKTDYSHSVEKVRDLAQKYKARVMFPHDWEFFQTMKKAPNYYE